MAQFYLPRIGDGLGGTVLPGSLQLASAGSTDQAEILDCRGRRIAALPPRTRRLFIAIDDTQQWSFSDHPNSFPAADVTDLPAGGGGPHKLTHQDGGIDELNITALSGLLADPQAPLSHAHIIADTTGLQTILDGKASAVHSHAVADVTLLQALLDGKALASHTHAIADTTGLQSTLDAKAALVHTHAQADVTGLVAALAGKSAVGHTHAASEVVSGVLAAARIATGTPDGTKFLRDDQVWAAPTATIAAPFIGDQAPGSFTIPTGKFGLHGKRLTLTSTQRATIQGTARLIING